MRKYRFFIDTELKPGLELNLDAELSHYIGRVLALNLDDLIYLFNNTGLEFSANITNINRKTVNIKIVEAIVANRESALQINLAQVLAKSEKMDLVIQKATELGVHTITPLYSERAVVRIPQSRTGNKLEHWHKVACAASAQSWRNFVPEIKQPQSIEVWLRQHSCQHKLILSPSASGKHIKDLPLASEVTILIGPEGGFSQEEIRLATNNNFSEICLGPRILRTETAGLAAIAIIQALYGDC